MLRIFSFLLALSAFALSPYSSHATVQSGLYHWVQYEQGKKLVARIVVSPQDKCPIIKLDGEKIQTTERENHYYKKEFPIKLCQAFFSSSVQKVEFPDETTIVIPRKAENIAVIGDTGCRGSVQDCNNKNVYKGAMIAEQLAQRKEVDLVVHVGDYVYNTAPSKNLSFPSGDNWEVVEFEFLQPWKAVMLSRPLVMARGNHEGCHNGGAVWFTLFDVSTEHGLKCKNMTPPNYVDVGDTRFLLYDSSGSKDTDWSNNALSYSSFVDNMRALKQYIDPKRENIMVTHKPLAYVGTTGYTVDPTNGHTNGCGFWSEGSMLRAIMRDSEMLEAPIAMVLSGHFHNAQLLSFRDASLPVQLVSGNGGAELRKLLYERPSELVDCGFFDSRSSRHIINGFFSADSHGFAIMGKAESGFGKRNVVFYDAEGTALSRCSVNKGSFNCD